MMSFATQGVPRAAAAESILEDFWSGGVYFVNNENASELADVINKLNEKGQGLLILAPDVVVGELPVKVGEGIRILDLRYNNALHLIRGNHPRIEGIWPQYTGLETGLRDNVVISDIVTKDSKITNWEGQEQTPRDTEFSDEAQYPNQHNHYQNFLSEIWNFNSLINTVAIWGDSGAFVPGAKVWGGFLSARSWPVHWDKYVPEGDAPFNDEDFDAQLVGLEIDVLNGGKPWPDSQLAKTGLQVVGFGKTNTTALEVRSEDTDAGETPDAEKRGTFMEGLLFNHSLAPEAVAIESRLDAARRGLDFSQTTFSEGAILVKSTAAGTGILVNNGDAGEIFGGPEGENWLNIRSGKDGLRILSSDGEDELVVVDKDGNISLNGTVFLNGEKIEKISEIGTVAGPSWMDWLVVLLLVATLGLGCCVYRLQKKIATMTKPV